MNDPKQGDKVLVGRKGYVVWTIAGLGRTGNGTPVAELTRRDFRGDTVRRHDVPCDKLKGA